VLIYGISLTILACVLVLSYKHMQGRLNPKNPALPPSRLENCQNLKINDLKLIAFANRCLLEHGKGMIAYSSAKKIDCITCPKKITDFAPPEIKRYSESDIQKFYKSRNEKIPEIKLPDEWIVFYHNKKGYMGGDYMVRISPVTCECTVDGVP